jgi:hypothetical protein
MLVSNGHCANCLQKMRWMEIRSLVQILPEQIFLRHGYGDCASFFVGYSANFCSRYLTTAFIESSALDTEIHSANKTCAECQTLGKSVVSDIGRRDDGFSLWSTEGHSAKPLPSVG